MAKFADVLRHAREQAGYTSSRGFYNRNGGTKFFGCTYRHYLNVESGKTMPSGKLIDRIAVALGLLVDRDRARAFVLGYLNSTAESEELVNLIVQTLGPAPDKFKTAESPLVDSMARVNKAHTFDLSREQSEWQCKSPENYWTFTIISHDKGAWDAGTIADATGFDRKKIESALKDLLKFKLVRKQGKDAYACPHAGKVFQHPDSKIYSMGLSALRDYRKDMAEKNGETLMRYHFFSRAPESELRHYFQYLIKSVQGAEVCSTMEKGPDTTFFEIETNVRKVLPF
ncbi:MAG: hypothetical protein AUJ52_05240 [Elusimicrobia bacterium CG1_02_63_36]|nr:MAG: hypothetical protein AUJ52_05240 [Elusimicrobia bacterium CG1_02_63_36]PIP82014.1 MAG: hypothetical protein COR54_17020 [Elusimicrobia bacterium CG22_combo_CG10-13_8_21_14_all_63_91]PJA15383.1 MAG: hypothetical protein COX66_10715 [Elusimicrobia bacterium CG_4_10_14_0_2_um_filter_63_34]PJB26932.1 MAG: hypothetical protein CO113_00485 [Elusimicrobia bacterium CG_4_9_14_3_um_filter_62_55]